MDVQINWLAVVLATFSSMIVGSLWYMPALFGKAWMKYTGVKMDRKMSANQSVMIYGGTLVASFLTAFVLAHMTFLANHFYLAQDYSWLMSAFTTGFWLWLGFTAARFLVHDLFEGRRKKLFLLNAGHELVTVLVMALIIGLMGV